jgi:hypothetical protein
MLRSLVGRSVTLAVAAVLVACSDAGGGDTSDRQAYVDAFVDAATSGGGSTGEEQARCFAESAVDAVGVAGFRESDVSPDDVREGGGVSPADLGVDVTEDQGTEYYERLQRCLDVSAYLVDAVVGSGVVTDESAECLEEAFDDDLARRIVVTDFVQGRDAGTAEVGEDLDSIYASCAPSTE